MRIISSQYPRFLRPGAIVIKVALLAFSLGEVALRSISDSVYLLLGRLLAIGAPMGGVVEKMRVWALLHGSWHPTE
jgi:hypothetical protein